MNHNLKKLIVLFDKLNKLSDKIAVSNSEISNWNVSKHIEHILIVNKNILKVVNAVSLNQTQIMPTKFVGYFVLITKYIPRGRNKTTENLLPSELENKNILSELEEYTSDLRSKAFQIEKSIKKPGKYNHHIFGGLSRKQWLRFMYIHTLHHYKILSDITRT